MLRNLIGRIAVDTSSLRESRDFRLLTIGSTVTGLGTQAALVALPYQVYVISRSAFLTGLLGLVELGPLIALSLFGGALADRFDRRRLLLLAQVALVLVASGLAAAALLGTPPLWLLYVLAGLSTAAAAVERVVASAMVPNLVSPERLRSALSLTFGLYQVTMVVGPGLGGLLIAAAGVEGAYIADAVTCAGMVIAAWMMHPQPPSAHEQEEREPIFRSIATGLRFVRGERALVASFVIDLCAMTFGMPRALFPVLSLTVYHAGAGGTGALFSAVAAGATVAALTTGWLPRARWLGRIVLVSVAIWGIAIALAGVTTSLVVAVVLLALAGAADSVSAVCRSTISQTLTPDRLRGRMSSVFSLVVASGPRLGDIESGAVASLSTPRASVVSGGVACVVCVGLVAVLLPELARYDGHNVEARA